MSTVLKGDSVERKTEVDVEAHTVRTVRTVKLNEFASVSHLCDWTFDFSGCEYKDILELATRILVIERQQKVRKPGKGMKSEDFMSGTINVAEKEKRQVKSKAEKARELLASVSEEERKALLAMFKEEEEEDEEEDES